MINKYPIQFLDLRFEVDHINPKKNHLYHEYKGATNNARLLMILIRQKESKMISDWNKITEVTFIWDNQKG